MMYQSDMFGSRPTDYFALWRRLLTSPCQTVVPASVGGDQKLLNEPASDYRDQRLAYYRVVGRARFDYSERVALWPDGDWCWLGEYLLGERHTDKSDDFQVWLVVDGVPAELVEVWAYYQGRFNHCLPSLRRLFVLSALGVSRPDRDPHGRKQDSLSCGCDGIASFHNRAGSALRVSSVD